jgi:thiamine pyrophosphokinase
MKRAVIFLHGDKPDEAVIKHYVQKDDVIITADGGTEYALEAGLLPDIVLGDFDSLSEKFQKRLKELQIKILKYPKEKDETDSELAIKYAMEKGYKKILLFAVFGSRVDHVLANLTMFANLQSKNTQISIIEGVQELWFVKDKLTLQGQKGEFISLIPLQTDVIGVKTKGLKWVLQNDTLLYGKTRGISNEFTGGTCEISVTEGTLLVVHTRNSKSQTSNHK